jgi:hypothetical protein
MPRWIQALVLCASLFPAGRACAADGQQISVRLRGECDALLRMGVQKPYGLAWPAPDGHELTVARGAHLVSMDVHSTPTAGLVLLWAGEALDEERYLTAAHQAARGVAASLQPNGRVPNRAVFDTRPRSRDGTTTAFADRSATYAGLALMLAVIDEGKDDAVIRSAATRAATFLTQQQTGTGAWAVSMTQDSEADDSVPARQVPLQTTDYRDATFAVLYAYEVLGSVPLRKSVEAAAKQLIVMRITRSESASGLWHGPHTLAAHPLPLPDGGFAVDALASRHALHTLFAVHLVLDGETTQLAIEESANRLVALRYENDRWDRLYPFNGGEVRKKPEGPDPGPLFHDPNAPAVPHGEFGIPPLLIGIGQVQQFGRAGYLARLSKHLTPRQHLAQMLVGLDDAALLLKLPTTAAEAKAYAEAHREEWEAMDAAGVVDVKTRVRRIHTLLIRRNVQRLLEAPPAAASVNPGN